MGGGGLLWMSGVLSLVQVGLSSSSGPAQLVPWTMSSGVQRCLRFYGACSVEVETSITSFLLLFSHMGLKDQFRYERGLDTVCDGSDFK